MQPRGKQNKGGSVEQSAKLVKSRVGQISTKAINAATLSALSSHAGAEQAGGTGRRGSAGGRAYEAIIYVAVH